MKNSTIIMFAAWLITAMLLVKTNLDKRKKIDFLICEIEKRDTVNACNIRLIDSIQESNADYSIMFKRMKK